VVDDNGCKIDVTPAFSSGMISWVHGTPPLRRLHLY
jgi:hypothetical protein